MRRRFAPRTLVLLTLVQTCKAHPVDPFAYLRDVIDRVSTYPMSRIDERTPRRWNELRAPPPDRSQLALPAPAAPGRGAQTAAHGTTGGGDCDRG